MIIKFINILQSVTLMIYKFITINTLRIQRKKEKQKSIDTKFSSSNFEIIFFRGCWSYVGNVGQYLNPQNIQKISLEEPGCISVSFFLMFDVPTEQIEKGGGSRMVIGFTTTYAISAYHH